MGFNVTTRTSVDKVILTMTPEEFALLANAVKKAYPNLWDKSRGVIGSLVMKVREIHDSIS